MSSPSVGMLAFYGVRRVLGAKSDPAPSTYPYREEDFTIPFSFPLTGNATVGGPGPLNQYTVQIQDYDFELRRIEYCVGATTPPVIIQNGDIGSISFLGVPGTMITCINQAGTPNLPFYINVSGNMITLGAATNSLGFSIMAANLAPPLIAANPAAAALITAVDPVADFPIAGSVTIPPPSGSAGAPDPLQPEFQMTLYDAVWRARSNAPVNCNRILHYNLNNWTSGTPGGNGAPMNFFPSPGIMYPVNSVIRFDIYSLLTTGAAIPNPIIYLAFKGVRRLPC